MKLSTIRAAIATVPLILASQSAQAQGIRDGDETFSQADLSAALAGYEVEFYDGSRARYESDGSYAYTYRDGDPPFRGRYEAGEDSQVCITFHNGFDRCDSYVMAGGRLVLIISDGTRFPARAVMPIE